MRKKICFNFEITANKLYCSRRCLKAVPLLNCTCSVCDPNKCTYVSYVSYMFTILKCVCVCLLAHTCVCLYVYNGTPWYTAGVKFQRCCLGQFAAVFGSYVSLGINRGDEYLCNIGVIFC